MVSGLKSKRAGLGNTTPVANKNKARSASRTKKMQSTKLLKKDKSKAAILNEYLEPEKQLEKKSEPPSSSNNVSGYVPSKPDASNYLPEQIPQTREERKEAMRDFERAKTIE